MTTTAEKNCYWFVDDSDMGTWATSCGETFMLEAGTPKENSMKFCCYCGKRLIEGKIPDPEPMECWVNYYGSGPEQTHPPCVHLAEERALSARMKGGKTVHMREVTPQDELDRKDAARYRKFREIEIKTPNAIIDYQPMCWDELIDKAMEDK